MPIPGKYPSIPISCISSGTVDLWSNNKAALLLSIFTYSEVKAFPPGGEPYCQRFKRISNVQKWIVHGNNVGPSVHCLDRNYNFSVVKYVIYLHDQPVEIFQGFYIPQINVISFLFLFSALPLGIFQSMFSVVVIENFKLSPAENGYLMAYVGFLLMVSITPLPSDSTPF